MYVHAERSYKTTKVTALCFSFALLYMSMQTATAAESKLKEVGVWQLCNVHYSVLTVFSQCRLPLISVALVEGRALGGGAELTTACDFR